jgi:hypothetical protein
MAENSSLDTYTTYTNPLPYLMDIYQRNYLKAGITSRRGLTISDPVCLWRSKSEYGRKTVAQLSNLHFSIRRRYMRLRAQAVRVQEWYWRWQGNRPNDGGSKHLWNVCKFLRYYTAQHPRRHLHTPHSKNLKFHQEGHCYYGAEFAINYNWRERLTPLTNDGTYTRNNKIPRNCSYFLTKS